MSMRSDASMHHPVHFKSDDTRFDQVFFFFCKRFDYSKIFSIKLMIDYTVL